MGIDGWYLATSLADQVCATSDTLMLLALRSASAAGVYAAIYRFPNAWLLVLGLVVWAGLPGQGFLARPQNW